eukprot:13061621-Alexandrium_andersonii.AAC.1
MADGRGAPARGTREQHRRGRRRHRGHIRLPGGGGATCFVGVRLFGRPQSGTGRAAVSRRHHRCSSGLGAGGGGPRRGGSVRGVLARVGRPTDLRALCPRWREACRGEMGGPQHGGCGDAQ